MNQISGGRPQPGVMFGITHELSGDQIVPIVREKKLLKVGIGLPKGKAIHACIDNDKKWKVIVGYKDENKRVLSFDTRAEAEKAYRAERSKAPDCPFPRKLSFFTFTTQTADGSFEADFDAIEAHGVKPTDIDIIFFDDEPFTGAYQMWSKSQLECSGDGVNAMQIPIRAIGDENKQRAKEAAERGEKYFQVADLCWTTGCPYSKSSMVNGKEKPSPCRPSGDLKFQLAKNIRVGGTAYFHTGGVKSIQQVFSAIYRFKKMTGGYVSGIPFKMTVRPYATNHNGQAATQWGISLEFRADTLEALRENMVEQALKFNMVRPTAAPAPKMIESSGNDTGIETDDEDEERMKAAGLSAEFYATGETSDEVQERLEGRMAEDAARALAEDAIDTRGRQPAEVAAVIDRGLYSPGLDDDIVTAYWPNREKMLDSFGEIAHALTPAKMWEILTDRHRIMDYIDLDHTNESTLAAFKDLQAEVEFLKPTQKEAAPAAARPKLTFGGKK